MTNPEIARMLGIEGSSTVSNYRACKGLPRGPRETKYDWDSVTDEQWRSMTNPEIARKLGIEGSSAVANYRARKGLPKESWALWNADIDRLLAKYRGVLS
ncbi:MAG: hypothetical protein RNU03_17880 [Candidatus Sedimenticola sp. (ex Thyasira tokunagai)]